MRYLLLIVALLVGCATGGESRDSGPRNMIGPGEIEASTASSVYELVTSERPEWLRRRRMRTLGEAAGEETLLVYMDNARMGPPASMRQIPIGSIRYVRYLSPREATQRWGAGHMQGAIFISTSDP